MGDSDFHKKLKLYSHEFVMYVYDISEHFPKSELYGTVSQLRRASVSIVLNYVEGYARFKPKVKLNFFEIAYGSAKESKYLIYLAFKRNWISKNEYKLGLEKMEEISAMLWSIITGMQKNDA
ncbi:MAG TPA: four helix bundle protein [Candidatus Magasanikbacteria bacterium]|nr:MAG: hypothetical protein A2479_01165 [Candidatus Magasanikbacteria bacterium RIFOXYC2_FULL_39_8]HAT04001.1 four helix bundle protein [Candidatus Magasanikbacteria bacterium]